MTKKNETKLGFEGQLRGDEAKEKWFTNLRNDAKVVLPKIGATAEVKLPQSKLNGAFLSCLDGAGALTLDGKKVSKMKVYSGEIALPVKFGLTFIMVRTSEASCKLKASLVSKK